MKDNPGRTSALNRREFVGALAGAATLGLAIGRAPGQASRQLRVGVIGGRFGAGFQWHEHPQAVVTAVCDLRQDRIDTLKRTYRCDTAYFDYKKLIADPQVEAVAVFTPAPLHVAMAVEALEAGKHVISAVPAGVNEQECVRLLETVRRTGLNYMMAEPASTAGNHQRPEAGGGRGVRRDHLLRGRVPPRWPRGPGGGGGPAHLALCLPADALSHPLHRDDCPGHRRAPGAGHRGRLGR